MRHLDLFAGIGGFSRAVEWLGGTTVGFVEWDAWNRRVLAKHWPEARYFGDITTVTDDDLRSLGRIDLITGGYPCQPFSVAGKRRGAEDDRHLWPEMRRVIDTLRPRFVLAENVAGHISMGLDTVLADLEADGYTAGAVVVPAGAVNALHRRDRVWIMAHCDGGQSSERGERAAAPGEGAERGDHRGGSDRDARQVADGGAGQDPRRVADANEDDDRSGRGEHQRERQGVYVERCGLRHEPGRTGDLRGSAPGQAGQPAPGGEGVPDAERQRPSGPGELGGRLHSEANSHREASGTHGNHPDQTSSGQAPRPLDAGTDGLRPGPLRRPAARSAWDDPDLIRAMWADGSWEADLPRVVTDEPERRQKLMAAGNAIVPLVAYEILRVMFQEDAV